MGEVINMAEWLEKRAAPKEDERTKRLAEIALERLLLQSEENQIRRTLGMDPQPM